VPARAIETLESEGEVLRQTNRYLNCCSHSRHSTKGSIATFFEIKTTKHGSNEESSQLKKNQRSGERKETADRTHPQDKNDQSIKFTPLTVHAVLQIPRLSRDQRSRKRDRCMEGDSVRETD
jgi:hypothetical protein